MSTKPRSRRKPARSLVPYGNREEDGAIVRAALPADLLDVLDLLFAVSNEPAPDAKALKRGLLPSAECGGRQHRQTPSASRRHGYVTALGGL